MQQHPENIELLFLQHGGVFALLVGGEIGQLQLRAAGETGEQVTGYRRVVLLDIRALLIGQLIHAFHLGEGVLLSRAFDALQPLRREDSQR